MGIWARGPAAGDDARVQCSDLAVREVLKKRAAGQPADFAEEFRKTAGAVRIWPRRGAQGCADSFLVDRQAQVALNSSHRAKLGEKNHGRSNPIFEAGRRAEVERKRRLGQTADFQEELDRAAGGGNLLDVRIGRGPCGRWFSNAWPWPVLVERCRPPSWLRSCGIGTAAGRGFFQNSIFTSPEFFQRDFQCIPQTRRQSAAIGKSKLNA